MHLRPFSPIPGSLYRTSFPIFYSYHTKPYSDLSEQGHPSFFVAKDWNYSSRWTSQSYIHCSTRLCILICVSSITPFYTRQTANLLGLPRRPRRYEYTEKDKKECESESGWLWNSQKKILPVEFGQTYFHPAAEVTCSICCLLFAPRLLGLLTGWVDLDLTQTWPNLWLGSSSICRKNRELDTSATGSSLHWTVPRLATVVRPTNKGQHSIGWWSDRPSSVGPLSSILPTESTPLNSPGPLQFACGNRSHTLNLHCVWSQPRPMLSLLSCYRSVADLFLQWPTLDQRSRSNLSAHSWAAEQWNRSSLYTSRTEDLSPQWFVPVLKASASR